jgi:hypothetical protein
MEHYHELRSRWSDRRKWGRIPNRVLVPGAVAAGDREIPNEPSGTDTNEPETRRIAGFSSSRRRERTRRVRALPDPCQASSPTAALRDSPLRRALICCRASPAHAPRCAGRPPPRRDRDSHGRMDHRTRRFAGTWFTNYYCRREADVVSGQPVKVRITSASTPASVVPDSPEHPDLERDLDRGTVLPPPRAARRLARGRTAVPRRLARRDGAIQKFGCTGRSTGRSRKRPRISR